MPHDNWRDAVDEIARTTGPVTTRQLELAVSAGFELPDKLPEIVAAARLQNALADSLRLETAVPCSDFQCELVEQLRSVADGDCSPTDRREAEAWITFLRLRTRQRALESLQLETGDVVEVLGSNGELAEVSSIGGDGRVYFKGGLGRGAWPDLITVRCRKRDESEDARQLRQIAANQRASRTRTDRWSLAKQGELRDFQVTGRLTPEDVQHLQTVIEGAEDEKPIQKLVKSHPQLLTSLLGGEPRFCVPHARLGAEFVPDFLVGAVDSMGIRWLLVELETPRSDVTLHNDNQLDKHGRKGVSQIEEWREWLLQNLDYARRSRRDQGLGLPDMRPSSDGLVIIGRRGRLNENAGTVRNPISERSSIRVHTYDWWLQQLGGILRYQGPWAANPYILHASDDDPSPW